SWGGRMWGPTGWRGCTGRRSESSRRSGAALRTPRCGWAGAAASSSPGSPRVGRHREARAFLAAQPIAVLPLDPATYRRLRRLGVTTLGGLAALPEEAVAAQFGR